jgi:hypothetical protein
MDRQAKSFLMVVGLSLIFALIIIAIYEYMIK